MKWRDMYEAALERITELNRDITLLNAILRSYLPILEKKDKDEKR